MSIYVVLFCISFLNEYFLTAYYMAAVKGYRWQCVGLSVVQQVVACSTTYFTLIDVIPMSHQQLFRFITTMLGYAVGTIVVVKPKETSDVS